MPLANGKEPDTSGPVGDTPGAGRRLTSDELESRSRSLAAKLAARGVGLKPSSQDKGTETASGVAQAVKLSSEFIAGVLAGAGLGWLADRFLGTSPWGLIVLLLLGFCAGTLNILRSTGRVAENQGAELGKGSDTKKPE
ncbi:MULTISPECIES: AtpZ/AtpI family protein [unclassified Phyllobacterium]|uniref:AtpZ/AtpI family protein n=1 Tax=unclassified Phyllobacterium TaxID=2638441 RepID=UPI000B88EA5B|nr:MULTISPECIES: AtpZ/AtpI family protein [unclassified Phyllobacterium]UGY11244.1 AtpZ/AtpI family protein [Phyllobacterium sp. T1018]